MLKYEIMVFVEELEMGKYRSNLRKGAGWRGRSHGFREGLVGADESLPLSIVEFRRWALMLLSTSIHLGWTMTRPA